MTRIITYEDGTVIKDAVQWGEIVRISAFKRDIFAYDLICFAIQTAEKCIEVGEDMEGWNALIDALPTFVPGMSGEAEWRDKIVRPPFATNWTILYTRS
jgi:hypothetical protein